MVIATASLVERALVRQVGDNRPNDSPTFFFIDIQPDQTKDFTSLLRRQVDDPKSRLTPLVRARLSALNGEPVKLQATSEAEDQQDRASDKEERRKNWYFTREYVLTFLEQIPKDNTIVEGAWWTPGQRFTIPSVSVEEEAAKNLGLTVGSTLEFDIQGTTVTAEVSSVRKVEWGNFSTNFYMILSPGSLDDAPVTYVATVRVPPVEEVPLQQAVVASFPNVTAINIGDVLDSFARILDHLSFAIRTVALFCVVAGGLVLAATLAATRYRRLYESVILKTLGATRWVISWSFAAEYVILGMVAGSIGLTLGCALSWALLRYLFDVSWTLQPQILGLGFLLTIMLTLFVGFAGTYRILGQRPLFILRHE
jgi:putative ABC transport system permease protein